ncbi:hypothetical protein OVA06_19595 [Pseudarthrobacter sp. SL88]|uniref:hypothetical protein n=1 Tax=Pseudarthrobacter sp. SL88 TaxID=2994666 RepID=UPI002272BDBA|nr:hypothetical protein [Pseudarthrobacter sp. SL88]MCY1676878.1 hypothetical protein [Pseudarthrobacter sp. SL88]
MHSLSQQPDNQTAVPLARSLDTAGNRVTSLIPPGYERYIRILNPIEVHEGVFLRWSDVASRAGLTTSPWMQWNEVSSHPAAGPGNNAQPNMGNPHPAVAEALVRVLGVGPGRYNFASWEGYWGEDGAAVIHFSPVNRGMVLYSGRLLDEAGHPIIPITASGRIPMYWWPDDLSWCIGQDIYARSLIVGCDLATAGRVLSDPELDAHLIRETDSVPPEDF